MGCLQQKTKPQNQTKDNRDGIRMFKKTLSREIAYMRCCCAYIKLLFFEKMQKKNEKKTKTVSQLIN